MNQIKIFLGETELVLEAIKDRDFFTVDLIVGLDHLYGNLQNRSLLKWCTSREYRKIHVHVSLLFCFRLIIIHPLCLLSIILELLHHYRDDKNSKGAKKCANNCRHLKGGD